MTYHAHGHNPTDAQIAREGFKAFGPARPAFVPTPADFQAAAGDMATGDPDELCALAVEVAGWWGDDEDTYLRWVV